MKQKDTVHRVLVFTDLVASTALKTDHGHTAAMARINRHTLRVKESLAEMGDSGRIIKNLGDGFFLTFEQPHEAVRFALGLQKKHHEDPTLPKLRVGIHQGHVEEIPASEDSDANDYMGFNVDLTSRICNRADPGQVLLSNAAFEDARNFSDRDSGLGPIEWLVHGKYRLRGAGVPRELGEVGIRGVSPLKPPAGSRHESQEWLPKAGQEVSGTDWILKKQLGTGSFGSVWLAEKGHIKRVFKFCLGPELLGSLKNEVRVFTVLRNVLGQRSDIARPLNHNFTKPPYYIEMEYAEYGTLADWAERKGGLAKIPLKVRLSVAIQVATALKAAHGIGVLHQDIKPSNILVGSEMDGTPEVQLADFGMGLITNEEHKKQLGSLQSEEPDSSSGGTVTYMAPELYRGLSSSATKKSDIYSLGVVLYQLVVGDFGKFPGGARWEQEIRYPLLREDIEGCLENDPEKRAGDAGELAADLRSLKERRKNHFRRVIANFEASAFRFTQPIERHHRDRLRLWSIAGILLAILGGLGVLYSQYLYQSIEWIRFRNQITADSLAKSVRFRLDVAQHIVSQVAHRPKLRRAVLQAKPWGVVKEVFDEIESPLEFFNWVYSDDKGCLQVVGERGDSEFLVVSRDRYQSLREKEAGTLSSKDKSQLELGRRLFHTSFSFRDWFKGGRSVTGDKAYVSEPFRAASTGNLPMIGISAPVFPSSGGGGLDGVLLGTITLQDLTTVLQQGGMDRGQNRATSADAGLELTLYNERNQIVAQHPGIAFPERDPNRSSVDTFASAALCGSDPIALQPSIAATILTPSKPRIIADGGFDGHYFQNRSSVSDYGWLVVVRQHAEKALGLAGFGLFRVGSFLRDRVQLWWILIAGPSLWLATPLVFAFVRVLRTRN